MFASVSAGRPSLIPRYQPLTKSRTSVSVLHSAVSYNSLIAEEMINNQRSFTSRIPIRKILKPKQPASKPDAPRDSVFACGQNLAQQLGLNHNVDKPKFFPSKFPGQISATKVIAGAMTSYCIDEQGRLWSWGNNEDHALGRRTLDDDSSPGLVNICDKVIETVAGSSFAACLTSKNELYVWGCFRMPTSGDRTVISEQPKLVKLKYQVKQIAAGNEHLLILDSRRKVWALGRNDYIQIALNERIKLTVKPIDITTSILQKHRSAKVVKIFASGNSSWCEVETRPRTFELLGWGNNGFYQLGTGRINTKGVSTINDLKSHRIQQISSGIESTLFLTTTGHVYACGRSDYGSTGTSDGLEQIFKAKKSETVHIIRRPKQIKCFTEHQNVHLFTRTARHQQLSNSSRLSLLSKASSTFSLTSAIEPRTRKCLKRLPKVKHVSTQSRSAMMITEDCGLLVFGDNYHGQLGLDGGLENTQDIEEVLIPVKLSFKKQCDVTDVSLGYGHSLIRVRLLK